MKDPSIQTAAFQRRFVWRRPQMDSFIESLLLGYPIPGVFFIQQPDKRYLVLDGQQRIRTLAAFYSGKHNKRDFVLENVAERALLVGLARRIDLGDPPSPQDVARAVEQTANDGDLALVVTRSTADEDSVRKRLAIATKAFLRS